MGSRCSPSCPRGGALSPIALSLPVKDPKASPPPPLYPAVSCKWRHSVPWPRGGANRLVPTAANHPCAHRRCSGTRDRGAVHHGARGRKKRNLRSKWWERAVGHVGKAWATDRQVVRTHRGARDGSAPMRTRAHCWKRQASRYFHLPSFSFAFREV